MLKPLLIRPTDETPRVVFDIKTNKFEIEGHSYPANAPSFYEKILKWLEGYAKEPNSQTNLKLNLDYWNSSSSKYLLQLIRVFEEIHIGGKPVAVTWYYDDKDSEDMGEEYQELLKCPFTMIAVTKK